MSKYSKFSKLVSKLKQAADTVSTAVPYIQSSLGLVLLVNQQVPSTYQSRINAVVTGAVKDVQALDSTLKVLVNK